MSPELTCPKCSSPMRSYERHRLLVDQCTGCGGLFLDRGELEALVAAENAWHAPQQPDQAQPGIRPAPQDGGAQRAPGAEHPQGGQPGYGQHQAYGQQQPVQGYGQAPRAKYSDGYRQQPAQHYGQAPYAKYSKGYPGQRRRRSFLSELFDD